jgi:hypothetical protein
MTRINRLKQRYSNCLATSCKDHGCSLSLDKVDARHVLISCNKYAREKGHSGKICDFILIEYKATDKAKLGVMEFKGGDIELPDIEEIREQLQNGANVAHKICGRLKVCNFIPFLIKKKTLNSMAARQLKNPKYKVIFRSFSEYITVLKHKSCLEFK